MIKYSSIRSQKKDCSHGSYKAKFRPRDFQSHWIAVQFTRQQFFSHQESCNYKLIGDRWSLATWSFTRRNPLTHLLSKLHLLMENTRWHWKGWAKCWYFHWRIPKWPSDDPCHALFVHLSHYSSVFRPKEKRKTGCSFDILDLDAWLVRNWEWGSEMSGPACEEFTHDLRFFVI